MGRPSEPYRPLYNHIQNRLMYRPLYNHIKIVPDVPSAVWEESKYSCAIIGRALIQPEPNTRLIIKAIGNKKNLYISYF